MNIRISNLFFTPTKLVSCGIAAVIAVVVVVVAIGAFLFFSYKRDEHLAKLTAEAPAQILNVKVTSNKPQRSSRTYVTRVFYKFDVNGRTIETDYVKDGDVSEDFAVGKRAKACYDPTYPDDNEIFLPSYRCGE
ncbi:MAG TPA: DUF3592 domain-containing protein [Pyrinomonadaceae bacterium]|nr:DUF3592 domain-containing protein [Pyrinomonadaceae bacterium]